MEAYKGTLGRRYLENEDVLIENPFLNDFVKIINSKAYRRLGYKTQVFPLPENPHVRTRAVHTQEVIGLAATIAEKLGLNQELCLAIAAGHDIGHTPYGHWGESVLKNLRKQERKKPFLHQVNSVVVAQHGERKGKGLNLTYETLEGILYHSRGGGELATDDEKPAEYSAVMFADKIAYTLSDLNDAIRYGHVAENNLPPAALALGRNQRERTNTVIRALVKESHDKKQVQFKESEIARQFEELRSFMYREVYPKPKSGNQHLILNDLYHLFSTREEFGGVDPAFLVSLLTDNEAKSFIELSSWAQEKQVEKIKHFCIFEILPYLKSKEVDYTVPDLEWDEFHHRTRR